MTLRGHGGDEEVTNKGQEEWGSVSQIKISKGGGAGELQEPQLGLCFIRGGGVRVSAPSSRTEAPKCEQVVGININVASANQSLSSLLPSPVAGFLHLPPPPGRSQTCAKVT